MAREGYMMVDHRASPGLTEAQARACGYDPRHAAEGRLLEEAILACCHCSQKFLKNLERTRPRERCVKCSGDYVCDVCALEMRKPGYVHRPFVKLIDDLQEQAFRAETNGNLYLPHLTKGP